LLLVEATPEDRNQLEKLGEVLELNDLLQVQLKHAETGCHTGYGSNEDGNAGLCTWILVDTGGY
jgi:hypothetical protein